MRQVNIFFKISNTQQCLFMHFVRFANTKLFCKSANQNKYNFMFTTFTKHVNNQTKKVEENMDPSHIYIAVLAKGFVLCFYLGCSGRVLQIRTNMIKVVSK